MMHVIGELKVQRVFSQLAVRCATASALGRFVPEIYEAIVPVGRFWYACKVGLVVLSSDELSEIWLISTIGKV